jgi:DNA-binding CsgD family transcriptional regulator
MKSISAVSSTQSLCTDYSLSERFLVVKRLLNSMSLSSAVIDYRGVIRLTNPAWRDFAFRNELQRPAECVGINYVEIASDAHGYSAEGAKEASEGLRGVIDGHDKEFELDYPCHSDGEERWFRMRASRLTGFGCLRALVEHENITSFKVSQQALRVRESELKTEQYNLAAVNTALKVVMQQRERDRHELEEKVLLNVRERVQPCIEALIRTNLSSHQTQCLKTLESQLEQILSPFSYRLRSPHLCLTPQEIRTSGLIIEGLTNKEIAEEMKISVSAVEFHRKGIRKKLGLKNKGGNLRATLLSLTKDPR